MTSPGDDLMESLRPGTQQEAAILRAEKMLEEIRAGVLTQASPVVRATALYCRASKTSP